jgi:hypothetical protein
MRISVLAFLFLFHNMPLWLWAQKDTVYYKTFRNFLKEINLPSDIKPQKSNNNIDITRYNGQYFLAFRTAPHHFPSSETKLVILSSTDQLHWKTEQIIHMQADLREPRFMVFQNTLWLFFFKGGKTKWKFQPEKVYALQHIGQRNWQLHEIENLAGYVPWRIRTYNNKAYLSAYYGKNLYRAKHQGDLRLFVSENGLDWKPISAAPQIDESGAEEGEFEFDADGNLWGTVRLEGKGAFIVYAHKDSLHRWKKIFSRHKYDSALMFRHKNDLYVISRRNIPGIFARAPQWLPYWIQQKYNLIHYWFSSKVTALFRLNTEKKQLEHILDFPSTGDNAFPAITQISDTSYLFFNYSSDYTQGGKIWLKGQLGPTYIYSTELVLKPVSE